MKQEQHKTAEDVVKELPEVCKLNTIVEAGILDVTGDALRQWCRNGVYPHHCFKRGKHWYLRPAELVAWMSGETQQSSGRSARRR